MTKNAELKGSSFTLSVLHLMDDNLSDAVSFLNDKVEQAPAFFDGAPVVIDISTLREVPDFNLLREALAPTGMIIVGITGCKNNDIRVAAKQSGLAVMSSAKSTRINDPVQIPTKVVTAPVRSGQQIYAKNCDLVVLNHVSAGAEIIADGSIHVYGVLRGRAIAGASGQKEAKIFCQDMQSELLSIAGTYSLSDTIPSAFIQRSTRVSLDGESLKFEHLTL
ncbi:septum site-determining protein MinC [Veronia nyctiphanis]|uniref:Probable septum site-determining protein MinC n=1 Tax=Veronia nyctiphanis TaxID=1278244 RepID=A0A4Q0YU21_9GAMM|nr:septum site-determining protein MinC [Veronia nyctiphanis]RXJ74766.1 septum site-determining protein MinC [Veronia nyctiphanis]